MKLRWASLWKAGASFLPELFMKESSVVVFDLGKVLLDFDYGIAAGKLAARSRLTPAEIQQLMDHSPLLYRFETGLLTEQEFFDEVRAASGYSGSREEFSDAFADIFLEIAPMVQLHAALNSHKVPTFILSNTNPIALRHIRKAYPFFTQFDGYVLSYEHRVMKPDAKIYILTEKLAGRAGEDIIYLDDRPENVEGGLARGWRALVHQTPERTISTLRQWGLPVSVNS
jgi:HAD superfamily hydrolase (TIGR01509 family)